MDTRASSRFGRSSKELCEAGSIPKPSLERRAATKNNENQSVCDRFSIVYLLYWNFLPRLGKLLNTRLNFGSTTPRIRHLLGNARAAQLRFSPRASFFSL